MCIKCGCGKKKGQAGYGMGPKTKKATPKPTVKSTMKPKTKATPKPKKTYKDATDRPGFLYGKGTV